MRGIVTNLQNPITVDSRRIRLRNPHIQALHRRSKQISTKMEMNSADEVQNVMSDHNEEEPGPQITLQVSFQGKTIPIEIPVESTILDVKQALETSTSIPPSHQKLLSKGQRLQDLDTVLSLTSNKLMLLGTPPTTVTEITSRKPEVRSRSPYAVKLPTAQSPSATPDSTYTFHRLVSLPYLPNAHLATDLLDRLRHDRGIIGIMKKYKWSVGALVEMDPGEHTYVDHKTLGLNRNKGEVIELRLRTDNYAGFRQYRCTPQPPTPLQLWC